MSKEQAICMWRSLFDSVDMLHSIGKEEYAPRFAGLTFNQLRMIKDVYTLTRTVPEGVTLKVLAESLSITPAAASEMVDVLVRRDFLRRDNSIQDRRAVAIRLSDSARERFNLLEKSYAQYTARFLDTLPPEKRDELVELVQEFHHWLETELSGC
ncbi:MAG: MarR family transcriptional regulator [Victivallaceae bacterium]|nr:MarR family transcriptional regulator [Victivallaceae bacterium]